MPRPVHSFKYRNATRVGVVTQRAVTPVVGVLLLVALTVAAAVAVGAAVPAPPAEPTQAALSLSASGAELAVTHRAGDPLATEDLRVVVSVDGERLRRQPPVPFFSARGFVSGPTGPFNRGHDGPWRAGETAALHIASTNRPVPSSGDDVRVRVWVDGTPVADLRDSA